jgi:hypothetical protein
MLDMLGPPPCECSGTGCNSLNNGRKCNGCDWVNVSNVLDVCDGVDNDCDGIIDNEDNGECVKNVFSSSLPNWRNGDCTSQCRVCQDNRILDITFSSLSTNSDEDTLNFPNNASSFHVSVSASSPNNCLVGYEYQLWYKDIGSPWLSQKNWALATTSPTFNQDSSFGSNGVRIIASSSVFDSFDFSMRYMPVGRQYKVRVQVVDSKIGNNVSGFTYGDNGWAESNVITVLNSVPSDTSVDLERTGSPGNYSLSCTVSPSTDFDVFSKYGSQTLDYFARIFKEGENPGAFAPVPLSMVYRVPLVDEDSYCCEAYSNDEQDSSNIVNSCVTSGDCALPLGKTELPSGEGVILGSSSFPFTFSGNKTWNFVSKQSVAELNYCEWGCSTGYVINPADNYSCVSGKCVAPASKTGIPNPYVLTGSVSPLVDTEWTYIPIQNGPLGFCEWTCMPGTVLDTGTNYGCKIENGKICLNPLGGNIEPGPNVFKGPNTYAGSSDLTWEFTPNYSTPILPPCKWRCTNKDDYVVNSDLYSCRPKVISPFAPSCSDLGLVIVSQRAYVENSKTIVEAVVSCENTGERILNGEDIKIFSVQYLTSDSIELKVNSVPLICDKTKPTVIPITLNSSEPNAVYVFDISYGGTFSDFDLSCSKKGVVQVSTEQKANITDSNALVALLVMAFVLFFVLRKK